MQKQQKRLGILGGTFNPPHNGHLAIAEQVYQEFQLDQVLLMPVGDPPHKRELLVAEKEHRRAMTALLAKIHPFLKLCTMEMEREGYTYTIDTLRALSALYGEEAKLFYIIGADTLFELETWKEHAQVFRYAAFICVMRPGNDPKDVERKREALQKKYHGEIFLSQSYGPDISSTQIRSMILQGKKAKGMVPDCILKYMEEQHVFNA